MTIIGSISLFLAAILYVLLVLGLPLGEFAMGGKYKVMPKNMRSLCAFSILVQLFAITILLQTGGIISTFIPFSIAKVICIFFAIYLTINTLLNAFSKSKKERYYITPLSIVTIISFWITIITNYKGE